MRDEHMPGFLRTRQASSPMVTSRRISGADVFNPPCAGPDRGRRRQCVGGEHRRSTPEGRKELVGLVDGVRESARSLVSTCCSTSGGAWTRHDGPAIKRSPIRCRSASGSARIEDLDVARQRVAPARRRWCSWRSSGSEQARRIAVARQGRKGHCTRSGWPSPKAMPRPQARRFCSDLWRSKVFFDNAAQCLIK